MNPRQTIEAELRQFLDAQENLTHEDRLRALLVIFDKHFALAKLDHKITEYDIGLVASMARHNFANQRLPMFVGKKQITQSDLAAVAHIEAILNYLNGHHILNKEVSINYTEGKL